MVRVRFPAAAPISFRLRVSTRPSLQNSAHSGSTEAACQNRKSKSLWGRGRKVMHLPCKQAQAGALPAVLHQFKVRETRPMHRSRRVGNKLLQVGVTPTPATNFREV